MSKLVIIHQNDEFAIWDADQRRPVAFGMSEVELEDVIKILEGPEGIVNLPPRVNRARDYGTSLRAGEGTIDSLLKDNRAGAYQRNVPMDELMKAIFIDKMDPS